jgi:cardiolipin synthase (CMP-forming)
LVRLVRRIARGETLRNLRLIPNQVTAVRLLFTVVIWGMVISGTSTYIGTGLVICFVSDVLDGQLARRLKQCTDFGAKFDSLADNLLIPSALVWLLLFRLEIYLDNPVIFPLAIATYFASLIIGRAQAMKFDVSQLYLSKLSGLTQYIFGIYTFISGLYSPGLFYVTIVIFFVSFLESLILQFKKMEINEHLTSILFLWPFFRSMKLNPSFLSLLNRVLSFIYGAQPSDPKIVSR